jgi:uncharacterized SAM-binding protein YcdF (DUF218 family)
MKDSYCVKAFDGRKGYEPGNASPRHGRPDGSRLVIYYISKVFWLIAAPTNALVLISAIAASWAVLRSPNGVTLLAATVACGLVIGTFTPIGVALTVPLERRFPFSPSDSQAPPDGIILLAGGGMNGLAAVAALSRDYPKARLIFSGFSAADPDDEWLKIFAQLGGDPARIYMESRPRTTSEDVLYVAALLKPKPSERWLLVTAAMHMPRAVGCFRGAEFRVVPYPIGFLTDRSHPFAGFFPGSTALGYLDAAAKEWIGLIAYRLMGKTDALFPGP